MMNMEQIFIDAWIGIIKEDMKTRKEYGYSNFGEPEEEDNEQKDE